MDETSRHPPSFAGSPCLAPGARLHQDHNRGEQVLLYPEGVLLLNGTAAAVLALCDGRHTVVDLISRLEERYHARRGALTDDVTELLDRLIRRGLVRLTAQRGRPT